MRLVSGQDGFDAVLAAAVDGDERAWRLLFDHYAPAIAGYLRVQGASDVDGLLGDVFLGVVRGIGRFRGTEAEFRSWIFVIAHHRLVDERRRTARLDVDLRSHAPESAPGSVPDRDTATTALDHLASDRVVELLAGLAPDQRDVLSLRIVGDLTIPQIAEVLDKSCGAVKALQRRGLSALQREISREGVPL